MTPKKTAFMAIGVFLILLGAETVAYKTQKQNQIDMRERIKQADAEKTRQMAQAAAAISSLQGLVDDALKAAERAAQGSKRPAVGSDQACEPGIQISAEAFGFAPDALFAPAKGSSFNGPVVTDNCDGTIAIEGVLGTQANPDLIGLTISAARDKTGQWSCVVDNSRARNWKLGFLPQGCAAKV